MKIINLIEDTKGSGDYLYEHGLSFYIETENHKILLDTGASDAFIRNAEKKSVDLSLVDICILSHGHYDHTGGVLAFAKINPNAKIYIKKSALGEYYNCKYETPKYIGIDKAVSSLPRVFFTEGNLKIDEEISLFTNVTGRKLLPTGNLTLKEKFGDIFVRDDFSHEQYLAINEGGVRVLLSGCAHKGILNILDEYKFLYGKMPTHIISGFHTVKSGYTVKDYRLIRETARELMKTNAIFYTGHCTGDYAIRILGGIMGERLINFHSGDELL